MIDFDVIRELRENHRWTQEQMAEKLEMTRNGYAKIERGESVPNLERLDEIATILGVKVIDLLKLENKSMVIQAQNYEANYYQNHQTYQSLQNEIEKLTLIIAHKDELLTQKDDYIASLKQVIALSNSLPPNLMNHKAADNDHSK